MKSDGTWKLFVVLGIIILVAVASYSYQSYKAEKEINENRYNGYDFAKAANNIWVIYF